MSTDLPIQHATTGPRAGRPALERCIPITADEFAAEYWARGPLLSTNTGQTFADLFGLAAVDELLSRRGLRTPFIRLAKGGKVIDPGQYTGSGGAGAEIADQVIDDKVLRLFLDGATIVLQALHRTWPPLVDFAQQLTSDLGHPVQINAYITPPQNQGFSAHYDVHDVFVLQVAGEKRWLIHPPVLTDPLRTHPWSERAKAVAARAEEAPVIDTVLRPGDALYLPRGWLHSAQALGETSVHLTLGAHPVTRHSMVEALVALAADVPELRASLPLGLDVSDPSQLAPQLTTVVEALSDWLRTADPSAVAASLRDRVWPQGRPEPVGPLEQAAAIGQVGSDTVVRLRRHLPHTLTSGPDGRLGLRFAERTLTLPALTETALKTLLTGAPVRVGDLPGLDADDQVVLVRRLLREAILKIDAVGPATAGEPGAGFGRGDEGADRAW